MRKFLALLLCLIFILSALASCNSDVEPPEDINPQDSGEEIPPVTDPEPDVPDEPKYDELDPMLLAASKTYVHDDGSILTSYDGVTATEYEEVCIFYEAEGYELYCENDFNGNLFSTYVRGAELAHVYWIDVFEELNILTSDTRGGTLPKKDTSADGDIPLNITQLQQMTSQTSGMAYIIQLADGSFIIYDGGYSDTPRELCLTLEKLKGDGDIHIRAWLITHSHDDHYSCFEAFEKSSRRSFCKRYL